VGWARKRKKTKKKAGEESHKTVIFHHHVGGAISQPIKFGEFVDLTDLSYHACQVWLQNIHWFFQADRWKIAFSLQKAYGLNNSAMRYRAGL